MLKKSMISIPATDPPSLVSPPANSYVSDPCEILLTGLQTDVELTDEQALSKVFAAIGLKNYHKFLANTRAWKPKNRRRPAPENTRSFIFKLSSPSVRDNCMMNASKLASVNTNELFDAQTALSGYRSLYGKFDTTRSATTAGGLPSTPRREARQANNAPHEH
ncbi:unnamed protein product [Trichogramma brassicae]|nr:unnamed protein product [Trichogramma brassicae]